MGIISTKLAQEAAAAAEEAAKERRRAAIRKEIDDWKGKLSVIVKQEEQLADEERYLERNLGDWEVQKDKYMGNRMLSEVVIENLSEGWYADDIKEELTICMKEMDKTQEGVGRLNGNIAAQIARLEEYESVIHVKLTSLINELRSI